MSKPLISIALCTYNGLPYLKELLDSLCAQTYSPLEILIRDDQSTDGSWRLIGEYQANYPELIRATRNPIRVGFQANFQMNFKDCQGEWIAPCDQDDIWRLDKLKRMTELVTDAVLIYHDSALIDSEGKFLGINVSDRFRMIQGKDPLNFLLFNCVSGHSMIFHKTLLGRVLPFPDAGYYDHWLAYIASQYGQIQVVREPLVFFRQHTSNQSDFQRKRRSWDRFSSAKKRMKRENKWLSACGNVVADSQDALTIKRISTLAELRESSYFIPELGWEIWKNRKRLLALQSENKFRHLAFCWRYSVGLKGKKLVRFCL